MHPPTRMRTQNVEGQLMIELVGVVTLGITLFSYPRTLLLASEASTDAT
jgi:hypothetical protein